MSLEAKNIYFRYNNEQDWVLKDCSLHIEKGEIVALLAPSGYGKTTLSMLLAGYIKPNSGDILLDGKPLSLKGICPVQLIYQHPEKAVNPYWKMKKVLAESGQIEKELLEALGIKSTWLERFPRELSGGELQRFCIARALLSGAEYIICDEITSMLDAISQAQIWSVIMQEAQKRKLGVIAITHNKYLAEKIATRSVWLGGVTEFKLI